MIEKKADIITHDIIKSPGFDALIEKTQIRGLIEAGGVTFGIMESDSAARTSMVLRSTFSPYCSRSSVS